MSRLLVCNFAISLDGYGAGPNQSLEEPLGHNGESLHNWVFETDFGKNMFGSAEGGSTGIDNDFMIAGVTNIGATIMGRNMFGPIRGEWPNYDWKGWWGDEPPYHHPVFVLTHYPRPPLEMIGTTFHFVAGGIEDALEQAKAAAGGQDIRLGGGTSTVRQYLRAGLVDELHAAVSPVLLGSGEHLFAGLDLPALGYEVIEVRAGEGATHIRIGRR